MSELDWQSRAAMGHPDALARYEAKGKGKGKDGKVQKGRPIYGSP